VARKKNKGTDLSVFKGREAKLNYAIFQILTLRSPLIIYDITREVRKLRGFRHTKYTNVGRRVKALEQQGYLSMAGSRDTQSGAQGTLYRLTARAHVAIISNYVSRDTFVKQASEEALMAELAALILFLEEAARKKKQVDEG
jgi:DNA-binding MarR family transcriptional regulator